MSERFRGAIADTASDRERMHDLYRQGGEERHMAPHVVYPDASCPHEGCDQMLQAIDFRPEDHGPGDYTIPWFGRGGTTQVLSADAGRAALDPLHDPHQTGYFGGRGRAISEAA